MLTGLMIACAVGYTLAVLALGIHMAALVIQERRERRSKK